MKQLIVVLLFVGVLTAVGTILVDISPAREYSQDYKDGFKAAAELYGTMENDRGWIDADLRILRLYEDVIPYKWVLDLDGRIDTWNAAAVETNTVILEVLGDEVWERSEDEYFLIFVQHAYFNGEGKLPPGYDADLQRKKHLEDI